MKYLILALLAGCAQLPGNPENMSPEQLREYAKDKSASVQCVIVFSPWGKGVVTSVNLDKSVVATGSVSVNNECLITIVNESKARP